MKILSGGTTTALLAVLLACGGDAGDTGEAEGTRGAASSASDLTEWELEHGIGPVTEAVSLGAYDAELAERGEEVFELKCSACHRTDERYVGPALGTVLERRKPEYVMNMMLNPAEMVQRHPEARALLAEYLAPMPNQNLTEADARALIEYLRGIETDSEDDES